MAPRSKEPAPTPNGAVAPPTTAIVPAPVPTGWNLPRNLAEAIQIAELVAKSGSIPNIRNAGQALLAIMAGAEMGFGPFASLVDVHIIEGKPSVGAHLKAASIKRSGRYDYRILRLDREACELEFLEGGKPVGKVSMTLKEAAESGLAIGAGGKLKSNWARTPDDMLFARCISKGYRRYCPDLTGGVLAYDPDELDGPQEIARPTLGIFGEVIAEAEVVPAQTASPLMATTEQIDRFGELLTELAFSDAEVCRALARRQPGATSVRELTAAQAVEILASLETVRAKREELARPVAAG